MTNRPLCGGCNPTLIIAYDTPRRQFARGVLLVGLGFVAQHEGQGGETHCEDNEVVDDQRVTDGDAAGLPEGEPNDPDHPSPSTVEISTSVPAFECGLLCDLPSAGRAGPVGVA